MIMDDYDGQMIFGDLGGRKLPEICLTGEEKTRKSLTQETCPDRGSNPGLLRDRRACYRLFHSGGLQPVVEPGTSGRVVRYANHYKTGPVLIRLKFSIFQSPLFMSFHILINSFYVNFHLIYG